ncbi:hypothetical protein [Acetobacter conturbans]|uniref:hypothetical protein n=1 Tax=Acetobacter conturbans TaxID=1737472 RepID=UPI00156A1BF6
MESFEGVEKPAALAPALSVVSAVLGEKMAPCPAASDVAVLLSGEPETAGRDTPAAFGAGAGFPFCGDLAALGLCLLNSKKKPRHSCLGRQAAKISANTFRALYYKTGAVQCQPFSPTVIRIRNRGTRAFMAVFCKVNAFEATIRLWVKIW